MNNKYQKYIEYIARDIQVPYLKSLEPYGLKQYEIDLVLGIEYNQPVTIKDNRVYDKDNNEIYYERRDGYWMKYEYDDQGNEIYHENSYGKWYKKEYDGQGNITYYENSNGYIRDNR